MGRPKKPLLTAEEIRRPFEGDGGAAYGPVLDIDEVAELFRKGVGTIREWKAKGRLDGTFVKRGKHILFWRDKVIHAVFNTGEWKSDDDGDE